MNKLRGILLEKENLLKECSELLSSAQIHISTQNALNEKLSSEKSQIMDDAANAMEQLQSATTKFDFESQEFKVHLETLEVANEKLRNELESKEFNDPSSSGVTSSSPTNNNSGISELCNHMILSNDDILKLSEKLNFNEETIKFLKDRELAWKTWTEEQFNNNSSKIIKELENSRLKLSNELQTIAEKNMELEMSLSQLKSNGASSSNPEAEKLLSTRERNQMRMQKKFESLQQRLEQLVFVHRQLLRKYAALELDVAEDKKKISLRDERIAQV